MEPSWKTPTDAVFDHAAKRPDDPAIVEAGCTITYRDLAVKDASGGQMRAQLTKAKRGMTAPTGWHYHVCDHQFVYVLNGWVELEFEGGEMLRCGPGDTVYIPGGLKHNELRTSDDFEILEVSTPGEIGTVPCEKPAA